MHRIIFIHSPVNGRVGGFHVLVIVNGAAVNIRVQVSFQIIVFSGYMTRSTIAGSYGKSNFSFLSNCQAVFIVTVPIYIPTNNVGGFPGL